MMRWFHRKLKPIARTLLASLAALWLIAGIAPCVMAQPQPMNHTSVHCPMHDGGLNMDADDCGPGTAVSCQLPDLWSPGISALVLLLSHFRGSLARFLFYPIPDNSIP